MGKHCPVRPDRGASRQRRVDDDVAGDLPGIFGRVALEVFVRRVVKRAAHVKFRVDDRPMVVELHALELREVDFTPRSLRVLHLGKIGGDLDRVQFVLVRNWDQWTGGEELLDEAAEGGVKRSARVMGVSEQSAPARINILPQRFAFILVKRRTFRGRAGTGTDKRPVGDREQRVVGRRALHRDGAAAHAGFP